MKNEPFITIITPSYNSKDYILETIDSVLNQSYQNYEMLIIDDCSNDGSYEIVRDYIKKDQRIKVYRLESNSGCPAVPRNFALEISKGEYIAFLDSDDIWHKDKLTIQIKYMIENHLSFTASEIKIFHNLKEIEKAVNYEINFSLMESKEIVHGKLIFKNIIPNSSVVIKKDLIDKLRFNEDIRYKAIEDYHMWLRILEKGGKCCKLLSQLLFYRIAETSISKSKFSMFKKHIMLYTEYKPHDKPLGLKKYLYLLTYGYFSFVNKVLRRKV
jgi:teichuronic acid biosynthesis glycosyltransferase TuaG